MHLKKRVIWLGIMGAPRRVGRIYGEQGLKNLFVVFLK